MIFSGVLLLFSIVSFAETSTVPEDSANIKNPDISLYNDIESTDLRPIAVIDSGIDVLHEQFVDNFFANPGEVPGNGIDDDENGKVDDFIGWDFRENDNNPHDNFHDGEAKVQKWDTILDFLGNVGKAILEVIRMGQNGHGTHVAGIISKQIPTAPILPLRVQFMDFKTWEQVLSAVEYAIERNAIVINMSLGGKTNFENIDVNENFQKFIEIVKVNNDTMFVIAAGNDGVSLEETPFFPAIINQENVITVGATTIEEDKQTIASYSNYSRKYVDVYAHGTNIESAWPGNTQKELSGTSMATPLVAAEFYKVYLENPNLSIRQLRRKFILGKTSLKFISKYDEEGNSQFSTIVNVLKKERRP